MLPNDSEALRVVLCWHMHQPQYRNLSSLSYKLPWTYLHGIKDYVDMAMILENNPKAKAVFNFSPILLEQLQDYAQQINKFFSHNHALNDSLLSALVAPVLPKDKEHYLLLVKQCLKANKKHLIESFPKFGELVNLAEFFIQKSDSLDYANDQYLSDFITWYHLAWMAETTRNNDERIIALIDKGQGYTMHERLLVLRIIGEQLSSIVPRYRQLVNLGQVELSLSPYSHPIFPLLIDFKSAQEATPKVDLPKVDSYPGGKERCKWHLDRGLELFEYYFGVKPIGCWPAEGAISNETLDLLNESGFKWTASGQQVLQNSLNQDDAPTLDCLYHPYLLLEQNLCCFFRDDRLSELIGFTNQDRHGEHAVDNLIRELEGITHKYADTKDKVVSLILDGENCWECSPDNGYNFISSLYKKLGAHPTIKLSTFEECLSADLTKITLPTIVAGSWINGTLSTWIGNSDKNAAWDELVKAKRVFDRIFDNTNLDDEQKKSALEQLAVCEGSDWFWWLGDYNPAGSVSDFESLYREHLANLYRFLGKEIPEELTTVMSHGSDKAKKSGAMRLSQEKLET